MTRRSRAITAALATATLLLAGCSSDDGDPEPLAQEPTESAAASVEYPNADVMADPPARPEDERSPAGAVAFGEHVAETVWYASAQNDATAVRELDVAGDCTTCQKLATALDESAEAGERQTLAEPITVVDAQLAERGRGEGTWVVIAPIDRPAVTAYDAEGEVVEEYPAETIVMEMGIKWVDGAWQLFNYRYADEDGDD